MTEFEVGDIVVTLDGTIREVTGLVPKKTTAIVASLDNVTYYNVKYLRRATTPEIGDYYYGQQRSVVFDDASKRTKIEQ